ncbi:DUF5666 domain-containing protein [Vibrio sp. R78045]|uniref:DUF5666 domain-containing protein n=1 Tax=Vibrio sp. R78045 TaxID=3093868 RepID=UPI0036F38D22
MKKFILIPILGITLAGCGGSDSNSTTLPSDPVRPSTLIGAVESVNPVKNTLSVNGYTYQVSSVIYGETTINLTDVQPDMLVRVESAANDVARIELEPTITGNVSAINHSDKTFTVNGVQLQFDGLDNDIEVGDWVLVSSQPAVDAGYQVLSVVEIDVENDYPHLSSIYELEGRIFSIDHNTGTFQLGQDITVSYSDLTQLNTGQWVEVEGELQGDIFVAREVDIEGYEHVDGDIEIEGIVTWVANDYSALSLNYRGTFTINSQTRFEDGTKTDLILGQEVEVTSVVKNQQQIATVIEFEQSDLDDTWSHNEFECEGFASNYNMQTRTFEMSYCEDYADLPMSNRTIVIDAQTRFENIGGSNLNGARVEVEGTIINSQNIAFEIELNDD